MVNIGLVGEDPNDTTSISNLLYQKYKGKVKFIPLANRIKGYQLDTMKIQKSIPIEFKDKKCAFIIYVRDLDGFPSEIKKIERRVKWYKDIDAKINNKGLLLLNIWELEALILADIDTFNKVYGIKHNYTKNPMYQKDPKEELKRITSKAKRIYSECDCPSIFLKLKLDTVGKNCKYFKEFILELDEIINPKAHKKLKN